MGQGWGGFNGAGVFLLVCLRLGGLRAGHALGGLGEYPFLRGRRLAVSPLRRVTFFKRRSAGPAKR